eukprot:448905-Pyramimonas_sp.AAC.1
MAMISHKRHGMHTRELPDQARRRPSQAGARGPGIHAARAWPTHATRGAAEAIRTGVQATQAAC